MSEIQPLQEDPTVAQIRNYNDEVIRRAKAKTYIHSVVSDVVFTRIMSCETAKEAWNTLQEAFQGMKELGRYKFSISEENLRC